MPSICDDSPLNDQYIDDVLRSPECIIQSENAVRDKILPVTKWLFDNSKRYGDSFSPLDELMIEGFDENQIWEQIMLEYEPKLCYFESLAANVEQTVESSDPVASVHGSVQDSVQGEEESALDENEDHISDHSINDENGSEQSLEDGDQGSEQGNESEENYNGVDDEFFSLNEMEKFADAMDNRENDENNEQSGSEMDFIDSELLFEDPEALVHDTGIDNANDIHYEDFFGKSKRSALTNKKRIDSQKTEETDDLTDNDQEDIAQRGASELFMEDSETDIEVEKSKFEKQQENLQKVIKELETEAVAVKDWTLQGEVDANKRPKNSLLEQTLDVDYASKPVPVVTEENTASLEDIIKQRIKDELWDDVVRKIVLPEREIDPNKIRELDDSKNSKSLAEVYEDEYLKQTQDQATFSTEKDEALKKEHDEINQLFNGLSDALDALSNAYFTPKAPVLEVRVLPKPNVPAISMEEVIPANISDAKLITPEELYSGKIKKSQEEKNTQDRKRDRAAFKSKQKKLKEQKEKARKDAEATKKTGRKRLSDEQTEKNKALDQLLGQQNVTIISDSSNKKNLESAKHIKASVIHKGGAIRHEQKRVKTEHIRL